MDRTYFLPPLLLAIAAAAPSAHADPIYKCIGDGGKITYSQNPCYGETWQRFGAPPESQHKPQPVNAKAMPATEADKTIRKPPPEKSAPARDPAERASATDGGSGPAPR